MSRQVRIMLGLLALLLIVVAIAGVHVMHPCEGCM